MSDTELRLGARLNLLPDPALAELRPALAEHLERFGSSITVPQFQALLTPLTRQVLERGFAEAGAHEGTVWLADATGESLQPAHNTGPDAARVVGAFKQPLKSGLICMVYASEQAFLENDVSRNSEQSKLLDSLLQVETLAMVAVSFYFLRACRGVVSCVQLKRTGVAGPETPGFRPEHLDTIQRTAALLSQLIEFRILSQAVGWSSE